MEILNEKESREIIGETHWNNFLLWMNGQTCPIEGFWAHDVWRFVGYGRNAKDEKESDWD